MRFIVNTLAGFLLFIGITVTVMSSLELLRPGLSAQERSGAAGALVISILFSFLGSWLAWNNISQKRRQERSQLQAAFFRLVKERRGKVSVLDFAVASNLSAQEAKKYLDMQSEVFGGNFDVDSLGNIWYQFPCDS